MLLLGHPQLPPLKVPKIFPSPQVNGPGAGDSARRSPLLMAPEQLLKANGSWLQIHSVLLSKETSAIWAVQHVWGSSGWASLCPRKRRQDWLLSTGNTLTFIFSDRHRFFINRIAGGHFGFVTSQIYKRKQLLSDTLNTRGHASAISGVSPSSTQFKMGSSG
ncbi:hypothetical protein KIL84_009929 [Mauremys mutica]|uniref:Uncharacterized protein n=1 Tax=Mauremys mutica TaxID=74926 RepID=A0A9D4B6H6_9SAUR|nr:hypothetical protein KIL84_009929 [Mauremys mutica]